MRITPERVRRIKTVVRGRFNKLYSIRYALRLVEYHARRHIYEDESETREKNNVDPVFSGNLLLWDAEAELFDVQILGPDIIEGSSAHEGCAVLDLYLYNSDDSLEGNTFLALDHKARPLYLGAYQSSAVNSCIAASRWIRAFKRARVLANMPLHGIPESQIAPIVIAIDWLQEHAPDCLTLPNEVPGCEPLPLYQYLRTMIARGVQE